VKEELEVTEVPTELKEVKEALSEENVAIGETEEGVAEAEAKTGEAETEKITKASLLSKKMVRTTIEEEAEETEASEEEAREGPGEEMEKKATLEVVQDQPEVTDLQEPRPTRMEIFQAWPLLQQIQLQF
jgi:hypothetical protein